MSKNIHLRKPHLQLGIGNVPFSLYPDIFLLLAGRLSVESVM
jgi:hypothetical protein